MPAATTVEDGRNPFLLGQRFWLAEGKDAAQRRELAFREEEPAVKGLEPGLRPAPEAVDPGRKLASWKRLQDRSELVRLAVSDDPICRYIALVSGAGLGKTTNLKWLAAAVNGLKNGYDRNLAFALDLDQLPDTPKGLLKRFLTDVLDYFASSGAYYLDSRTNQIDRSLIHADWHRLKAMDSHGLKHFIFSSIEEEIRWTDIRMSRMRSACVTCTATSGNGARTGMARMKQLRSLTRRDLRRPRLACSAAVAGAATAGAAGRPSASGTCRTSGTGTSASVWPQFLLRWSLVGSSRELRRRTGRAQRLGPLPALAAHPGDALRGDPTGRQPRPAALDRAPAPTRSRGVQPAVRLRPAKDQRHPLG